MNPYEPQTPPLWISFIECWAGTIAMIPLFLLWVAKLTLRKLEALDWRISNAMRSESKYWWVWSRIGDGWAYAAVVLWLLRTGRVELAGHISACIVLAWGASGLLKLVFRRRRPDDVLIGRIDPQFRPSAWSFPSQHAACCVAFAAAVNVDVPGGFVIGFCLAFIPLSRVVTGAHYFSDVLAGVAVGIAAGVWG